MEQTTLIAGISLLLALAGFAVFKGANDWRTGKMRFASPGILLAIAAFCAYGFVAAGEPGQETWRTVFPILGGVCLLGAVWLAAKR